VPTESLNFKEVVMPNYNNMTLAQLEKKKTELSMKRDEILEEQKAIAEAIETKTAEESAKVKVEDMSPAEKKKAAQILGVEGIESGADG